LQQLRDVLSSGRDRVVLWGLGGVGKTSIAKEYIRKTQNKYSAAFWINGDTEQTLRDSFYVALSEIKTDYERRNLQETPICLLISDAIFRHTMRERPEAVVSSKPVDCSAHQTQETVRRPDPPFPGGQDNGTDYLIKAFHAWLKSSLEADEIWVLVFDNFHHGLDKKESRYIPTFSHGHIIYTSRRKNLNYRNTIEVHPMSEADGLKLLEGKLDDSIISNSKSNGEYSLNCPCNNYRNTPFRKIASRHAWISSFGH
jgi:hypothetical protein